MRHCLAILMLMINTGLPAQSPPRIAISTDFTVQHNLSPDQKYWAIGQNLRGEWKLVFPSPVYVGFSYYTKGNFSNQLTAAAKDPATVPAGINYINKGSMRFSHLTVGLKHYIIGSWEAEQDWNLYGLTGLGVLMGRTSNVHSEIIDTNQYQLPVLSGSRRFSRLTLDLGAGIEIPMGGDMYLYSEAKTFIPLTYFPSQYLLNYKYNPLTLNLGIGVRVLF